ncbi:hypothetical protein BDN71DRAFT_851690 [Pleurotus eryngii]|uniref:Uncharacterized protein n=1 Tax=Pleurotus eryngii TaxID=5323 RepID=A0A9P6A944_PLEER|nr:hypothetical protein BDN71DRAFT_851690 [Pleurotus eryngii]
MHIPMHASILLLAFYVVFVVANPLEDGVDAVDAIDAMAIKGPGGGDPDRGGGNPFGSGGGNPGPPRGRSPSGNSGNPDFPGGGHPHRHGGNPGKLRSMNSRRFHRMRHHRQKPHAIAI